MVTKFRIREGIVLGKPKTPTTTAIFCGSEHNRVTFVIHLPLKQNEIEKWKRKGNYVILDTILHKSIAGNKEQSNIATNLETTKLAEHLFICQLLCVSLCLLQSLDYTKTWETPKVQRRATKFIPSFTSPAHKDRLEKFKVYFLN